MKFLVIDRGGTLDLPSAEAEHLFMTTRDWVSKMIDVGKIEAAYALSGQMSTVLIFNVASHEELDDLLQEYPLSNFSVFEVYALSDALHSYEKAAQVFMLRRPMAA